MKKLLVCAFVLCWLTACTPQTLPETKTIIIPLVTDTPEPTPTPIVVIPTPTATPTIPTNSLYLIQPGDTLWRISERSGVPIDYLVVVNKIANPDLIYAGETLFIPVWPPIAPTTTLPDSKQIIVVLSTQRVYAYENGQPIKEFIVSTGKYPWLTKKGKFQIYLKLELAHMKGPGYNLKNVPWTMYFDGDNGLHGTYWHHNFGHPMSHGCVNLAIEDAHWLFDWAPLGTPVVVIN